MIASLEKALNVKLPPADQLDSQEANQLLSQLCEKHEVSIKNKELKISTRLLNIFSRLQLHEFLL